MDNFIANSRFIPNEESSVLPSSQNFLPEEAEIEPFSTKFFIKMIRLEEIIYSKDINQKSLQDLLSLYAKCVEHYDIEKDAIKYYFIEKIQSIISNKKTLKLIFKNSKNSKRASFISQEENEKEIKESKEENSSEEEDSSSNEKSSLNIKIIKYRKERKNLIQNAKKKIGKLNFVSISHKKIERAKKMSLFLKMQEDKRETNINQIISSYMQKCENNDEMVKEDLNSQISFIKARIEQKKKLIEPILTKTQEKKTFLAKFYSLGEIQLPTHKVQNNKFFSPFKPKPREINEK